MLFYVFIQIISYLNCILLHAINYYFVFVGGSFFSAPSLQNWSRMLLFYPLHGLPLIFPVTCQQDIYHFTTSTISINLVCSPSTSTFSLFHNLNETRKEDAFQHWHCQPEHLGVKFWLVFGCYNFETYSWLAQFNPQPPKSTFFSVFQNQSEHFHNHFNSTQITRNIITYYIRSY